VFDASGPCPESLNALAIVNAVFNGFQMLLLTWLGSQVRNGIKKKMDQEARDRE
jgi:hypothetical protein